MATKRRTGHLVGLGLGGAMLLTALIATPSVAGGRGAAVVRGIQEAAGTCENGGYLMTGSLRGCWWIDTFDVHKPEAPDRSHYMATGTEHFTGWIGDRYGTFATRYRFTAKTDGPWPTSAEIHGRCHHPITGGDGDFAGISGELSFKDVVDVAPPYYPYWGSIRLATGATVTVAASTKGAAAPATADGTTC